MNHCRLNGTLLVFSALFSLVTLGLAQTTPVCTPPPSGMVGWWPGDGNANDIFGGNNGTLVGGVAFTPGMVGQAFSFNGTSAYVSVPDSQSLRLGTSDFTIDFWLNTTQTGPNYGWLLWKTSCDSPACPGWEVWTGASPENVITIAVCGTQFGCQEWANHTIVNDGQWHFVALTRSGTILKAYVDGIDNTYIDADPGVSDPTNSLPLLFGDGANFYNGQLDEIEIFNRALSISEIQAIYNAKSAGKCKGTSGGPTITGIQPNTGGNSGSVTLSILGSGFQPSATATLNCPSQSILTTTTVTSTLSFTTATFDLTNTRPALCSISVINPDGSSATNNNAFTVVQGGESQVWVDIVGSNLIRIGSAQTYYIMAGNSGNVDSAPGLVSVSFPTTIGFDQMSGTSLFSAGSPPISEFGIPTPSATDTTTLLFATASVPPGATQSAPFQLIQPINISISDFTVTAAWDPTLTSTAFDNYLVSHLIPFQLSASCTACTTNASVLSNKYQNGMAAYSALQNAESGVVDAVVAMPVAIGEVIITSLAIEEAGISGVSAVVIGTVVSEAQKCVGVMFDTLNGPACIATVTSDGEALAGAVANLLAAYYSHKANLTAGQVATLGHWLTAFDALKAAGTAYGDLLTASGDRTLALGNFEKAIAEYVQAWFAYQSCLGQYCVAPTPLPLPCLANATCLKITGVSSLDPNEKVGSRGAGPQHYITSATPFRYAVYFANKDTATAPAQQVSITDQLDTTHDDLGTFSFGSIGFENQLLTPLPFQPTFSTTVDLRPTTNLLVAVNGNLNPTTGMLTWTFQSLDPTTNQPPTDPTVGFLPPGGNGSVFFTVNPRQGLLTNTQIQNQATIVFDVNAPINTPTWFNTLDNTPPTSHVTALPATETTASFPVNWTGSDVGSGIGTFTIYVSDNGGPFTPFQTNTAATSATFSGQAGRAYGFYSIATDAVGNVEPAKTVAEAMTTLASAVVLSAAQVSTTTSGLAYSRVSKSFSGTVTITNISTGTINGPFQIVFTSLATGVTLANATGTFNGSPFLTLPSVTSLASGRSANVSVQFLTSPTSKVTFIPVVYSGSF